MTPPLHLFEGYGVELEYMIVQQDALDVLPVADEVLKAIAGGYAGEVERGELAWSNELVVHVIELKTNGPAATLHGLADLFQEDVREIEHLLAPLGGRLLPTAMHPWMDPLRETRLWSHEYSPVYESFNRIFGCQGHGWSNLQSTHLNLPFGSDDEFGRLHAAIRLLLPILPALAASSPIADARLTGLADFRLEAYRHNANKIPLVAGAVVPEPVFTQHDYETRLLGALYEAIKPHDPEGILQYPWLNARGAIARFDRGAIEIRVLDIQECPAADLAVLALIVAAHRGLCDQRWCDYDSQQKWPVAPLAEIFLATIRDAEQAVITNADYLRLFGCTASQLTAGELWQHLFDDLFSSAARRGDALLAPLHTILRDGPLSRRILRAVGNDLRPARLREIYTQLADCLRHGRLFHA